MNAIVNKRMALLFYTERTFHIVPSVLEQCLAELVTVQDMSLAKHWFLNLLVID